MILARLVLMRMMRVCTPRKLPRPYTKHMLLRKPPRHDTERSPNPAGLTSPSFQGKPSETKLFSEDQTRERLQAAKSRSYCAGCRRRGHWHKDPECPLNQNAGANGSSKGSPPKSAHVTDSNDGIQPSVVQVAFEVGAYEGGALLAITDTACSKTVAGQQWLDQYLRAARQAGLETQLINSSDDFRFGASRLFRATFTATIMIQVQHRRLPRQGFLSCKETCLFCLANEC